MDQRELNEAVLSYVETTGKALGVALKIAEEKDTSAEAAGEKIAGLITKLRDAKLIDDASVKRAEDQLADPAKALDILGNVVDHYQDAEKQASAKQASQELGSGVSETSSHSNGHQKNANYVGRRRGYGEGPSESDAALLRLIDR